MKSLVSGPSKESQRSGARPYRAVLRGEERAQTETRHGRYLARKAARKAARERKEAARVLNRAYASMRADYRAGRSRAYPPKAAEITLPARHRESTKSQIHFRDFWTFDPATGSLKERLKTVSDLTLAPDAGFPRQTVCLVSTKVHSARDPQI